MSSSKGWPRSGITGEGSWASRDGLVWELVTEPVVCSPDGYVCAWIVSTPSDARRAMRDGLTAATKPAVVLHYSGGAEWFDARGGAMRMLPGYAVCCTGARAYAIRRSKRQTPNEREVTCKGCLRALAREQGTLDGVVAKVRAALVQRVGAEVSGRMTVNLGAFTKQDPGDPPHVAYITIERDQLVDVARDPDTGAEWAAGDDTRVRALEALLKLVERTPGGGDRG